MRAGDAERIEQAGSIRRHIAQRIGHGRLAAVLKRVLHRPEIRQNAVPFLREAHVAIVEGDDAQARIGEAPAQALAATSGAIGHVQIADVPDRHEPGSGELGPAGLLEPLATAGWDGWVGLEYRPSAESETSLSWLPSELRARRPRTP